VAIVFALPYPHPSDPQVSARMRRNPRRDTEPEIALRSELHRMGLRFRKDLPIRTADRIVRPDVVFTRARLAVFVDGCFWHQCPLHGNVPRANTAYWVPKLERNVRRDRAVDEALLAAGWTVLRAWEHEKVAEVAAKVQETLTTLRTPCDQAACANSGESTTTSAARSASRTPAATC
jgi:DNA mismatch endonuclease (patch repair protein)